MIRLTLVALLLLFCFAPSYAAPAAAPQEVITQDAGLDAPESELQIVTPTDPHPVEVDVTSGSDFTPILNTIRDTIMAVLMGLVTAALGWLTGKLAAWTNGKIKLDDTLRDLHMEQYAKGAVDKALAYALQRVGVTYNDLHSVQIKSQVLQYAVNFLLSQYPEVMKWIDKDNSGVIDWVETMLPSWALAPVTNDAPAGLMAARSQAPKPKAKAKPAKAKPGPLDIPPFTAPLGSGT